jgi:uncharacterized membrane protein YecN with MAPEG domain
MVPYVTAFYAGLLGLLLIYLCFAVTLNRRRTKVGLGSGGDSALERAIRVHANFTEYVPLALLLMGLGELNNAPSVLLHVAGIALLFGRLLHVAGLSRSSGTSFGRFWGSALTWLVILVMSMVNIWLAGARMVLAA